MKYLVDKYSMVDVAPVTELRSAADGHLITSLEQADISKLTANGWRAPEVFKAKGRDGVTDMWGIIQRPTNFDPSKKYPVIEYIYAGPGDAYTPKNFISYNWNMTPLAELGFIVVQLDAMGTSWRGKKFEEVCYKNLKDAGLIHCPKIYKNHGLMEWLVKHLFQWQVYRKLNLILDLFKKLIAD